MPLPIGYSRANNGYVYHIDGSGPYMVDADGSVTQGLPLKLYTDSNGPYARLRVDVGQTGFFAGREFRAFYDFSIATLTTRVIRLVCAVPMILEGFTVALIAEELLIEAVTGGAEGGSFATPITVFAANGMPGTSGYATQTVMATGGTHTGGTVRDIVRAKAGTNSANSTTTIIEAESPVGRAAIPLYIRMTNLGNGTATGVIKFRWEERP